MIRRVWIVKQAKFKRSFVVLETKVSKIVPGSGHGVDRKFFEVFCSRKSKIETAIITCVVSYVALCICIPCVIEGKGCIVLLYRVHECDSNLRYDFFQR